MKAAALVRSPGPLSSHDPRLTNGNKWPAGGDEGEERSCRRILAGCGSWWMGGSSSWMDGGPGGWIVA